MCLQNRILNLSSDDSKDIFPGNTPGHFIVKLPKTMKLCGIWDCAITQIDYTPLFESEKPKSIYVCCDIIQPTYGTDSLIPALRKIPVPQNLNAKQIISFPQNDYIRMSREQIQYIHVYIYDENLKEVTFSDQTLNLTLHFKQVKDCPVNLEYYN